MDEQELRATVRAGLERHAAETDVTAPVADRARDAVRRRRRTRWSAVGAAAAVVLVVGGAAVATRGGDDVDDGSAADRSSTAEAEPADTTGWRTEYWGPVAVDVPPDWGYGGAPLPSDPLTVCGPGGGPGYVGRPIVQTDACVYLESGWQPDAPYVWLGADVEPGTSEWDNGYVQETVEVAGTTVTVGSDDPALRAAVVASVREEQICRPRLEALPDGRRESTIEGIGSFREGAVCTYRRPEGGEGEYLLAYAAPLGEEAMEQTWTALDDAPPSDRDVDCALDEFVVVSSVFNDPYSTDRHLGLRWDAVYRTDCDQVEAPSFFENGKISDITDELTDPWIDAGVRATLSSFIGPIG
jgi:hypothetical protein